MCFQESCFGDVLLASAEATSFCYILGIDRLFGMLS